MAIYLGRDIYGICESHSGRMNSRKSLFKHAKNTLKLISIKCFLFALLLTDARNRRHGQISSVLGLSEMLFLDLSIAAVGKRSKF